MQEVCSLIKEQGATRDRGQRKLCNYVPEGSIEYGMRPYSFGLRRNREEVFVI
jgi:hypothetical protein